MKGKPEEGVRGILDEEGTDGGRYGREEWKKELKIEEYSII
jgi:hypothetical protein